MGEFIVGRVGVESSPDTRDSPRLLVATAATAAGWGADGMRAAACASPPPSVAACRGAEEEGYVLISARLRNDRSQLRSKLFGENTSRNG